MKCIDCGAMRHVNELRLCKACARRRARKKRMQGIQAGLDNGSQKTLIAS